MSYERLKHRWRGDITATSRLIDEAVRRDDRDFLTEVSRESEPDVQKYIIWCYVSRGMFPKYIRCLGDPCTYPIHEGLDGHYGLFRYTVDPIEGVRLPWTSVSVRDACHDIFQSVWDNHECLESTYHVRDKLTWLLEYARGGRTLRDLNQMRRTILEQADYSLFMSDFLVWVAEGYRETIDMKAVLRNPYMTEKAWTVLWKHLLGRV